MTDEAGDSLVSPKLITHLLELRRRLLNSALALFLIFFCLFPFQNQVFAWVARPMLQRLPAGSSMIATGVASPFMTPMKLSLVVALFLAVPVFLYHLWRF
ncbi:MAG TPA: twin-arginine translocase subunit TatC, partial [Gammaproteobacteria bacterium]|nr:twin-arginine translocase subunit TatC [Gammaproteobacteria bacterium]